MVSENTPANGARNIEKAPSPREKGNFDSILSSMGNMPADNLPDEALERILSLCPKEIDSQQADNLYRILEAANPRSINARFLAVNVAAFYLQRNLFRISVYLDMPMSVLRLSRYAAKEYITIPEVQSLMEDRWFIPNTWGEDIAELAINNSKMGKLAKKYSLKISYEQSKK